MGGSMNLIDAIGKEHFIFEEKQYTHDDFVNMPSDELEAFKARINVKITDIADIIKEKRKIETKEWYSRRKYVLSLHNKMIPYIKSILKERRKAERNIGDCFMDQAKLMLPADDFEHILNNAQKHKEGQYEN